MSFFESMRTDIESLASHTLSLAGITSSLESRFVAELASIKTEVEAKFDALKAELVGEASTIGSAAVATLGAKVAEMAPPAPPSVNHVPRRAIPA